MKNITGPAENGYIRIAVDVGGTNTDAVVLRENEVLATYKTTTTNDITTGILKAAKNAISLSGVDSKLIRHMIIGTTHLDNALKNRKVNKVLS